MTRFVALLYHDVHRGDPGAYGRIGRSATSYHVSETVFKEHLSLMRAGGLPVLSADQVTRCFTHRNASPAGPALALVVSFDDGWAGAVERAAPLLAQEGLPAIFFITTGFLGRRFFARPEALNALDPALFTIGSHGVTHRMLSTLPDHEVRRELVESKHQLENALGRPIDWVSIPGGAANARVIRIAREAGYSAIWTSVIAVNPTAAGLDGIGRIGVRAHTDAATFQRWLAFDLRRERLRNALLAGPKNLLGMRTYTHLRRALLGEARGHSHVFEP